MEVDEQKKNNIYLLSNLTSRIHESGGMEGGRLLDYQAPSVLLHFIAAGSGPAIHRIPFDDQALVQTAPLCPARKRVRGRGND